jgi:hypothetical protein
VSLGRVGLVDPLALEQRVVVEGGPDPGRLGDACDEVAGRRRRPDHLVLGHVLRPGRVAEQVRKLGTPLHQLVQHIGVRRVRAVTEESPQLLPGAGVPGVHEKGQVIRVIGRDVDRTVVVGRMGTDVIGR